LHNCERFGQLQGVRAAETLKISHRPHGRLTFCSLFAGRWCLCLFRHSVHLIVHHQWEHSLLCARSSSKVPIAPMGDCLADMPNSIFAVLLGSDLVLPVRGTCQPRLHNAHGPDGIFTCVALVLAGRRCLRLFRHGHDNVFLHLREYSFFCARCAHAQKFPSPHGILTFCSLFAGRRCLCRWWLSDH
jgi:hypothetical protein